jgi:hypothetical protein
VLDVNMQNIQRELARQGDTLQSINASLQALTKLEEGHKHVTEQLRAGSVTMAKHEDRIVKIETVLPPLVETRKWVIGGILTGVSMIGLATLKLVIVDPVQRQQAIVYVPAQTGTLQAPAPAQAPAVLVLPPQQPPALPSRSTPASASSK